MSNRFLRILPVLFALTVCTSLLHAANVISINTGSSATVNLACTMGSSCTASTTEVLTDDSGAATYTLSTPTVPWLSVSANRYTFTNPTTATITFAVTSGWTTLLAGLNSTTITVNPTGVTTTSPSPLVFTVYLQVSAPAPTLQVKGGVNVLNPYVYTPSNPVIALSMPITLVSSSGLPIPFAITGSSNNTPNGGGSDGGALGSGWLSVSKSNGIAYSWGTTINVIASQAAIINAYPGDVLTGSLTITPSAGSALTVPVAVSIGASVPTIVSASPNVVPLQVSGVAPGTITVVLKGTGFVATPKTQQTKLFWGATSTPANCTNVIPQDNVTVINGYYLQVAVPYDSTGSPFKTAGTVASPSVYLCVANGTSPTAPASSAGMVGLGVTAAPIVYGITSASSYVVAPTGTRPSVAPYDIISIFGTNLCPDCSGPNALQIGVPDATYSRFPTYLSPDSGTHKVSVQFVKPGTSTTLPGYLLFATNGQINVTVPGAISTLAVSSVVNVTVGYGTTAPAPTANTSIAFPVTPVAVNPGIFTVQNSGQGPGAITWATGANTGLVVGTTDTTAAAHDDNLTIWMTGLGAPDSTGANTNAPTAGWSAACVKPTGTVVGTSSAAPDSYMAAVNTPLSGSSSLFTVSSGYAVPSPAWTSIDGAVIAYNFLSGYLASSGILPPCFLSTDTITVSVAAASDGTLLGGAAITPTYVGWSAGSIGGLDQINFTVPSGTAFTNATEFYVTVNVGSTPVNSQAGVQLWIK